MRVFLDTNVLLDVIEARARTLKFPDFEDAMQCVCAESCQADIIITRNTKDFIQSPVLVLSPGEFLLRHAVP